MAAWAGDDKQFIDANKDTPKHLVTIGNNGVCGYRPGLSGSKINVNAEPYGWKAINVTVTGEMWALTGDETNNVRYNPTVSDDDGSCEYCSCNDCSDGCTNADACNYDSNAISDDDSCLYLDECGECGGEGILEGACDCDGNILDIVGVCGGDCTDDDDGNGICDDFEVFGCTYLDAVNYDSLATADDGSCLYDDVSSDCPSDIDGDGTVTTQDLLSFLSFFGQICE